ncbi:MAG: glycosyltransferase family 2 protein [Planctomycetes bacterium]|nr:glycosyltransferase family 2 protein [Planctomycetota bacterium]
MTPHDLTVLVLTYNEAPNLHRTLEKLAWARDVLVVDSYSTDDTLEIAESAPQVRVLQRKFDTFAGQCNFGLEHIRTPWVLSVDADYVLTDALIEEIRELSPTADVNGYRAAFRYCVYGKPLRACLYPPRTVLYRRERAHYRDEGHGHRVQIDGEVRTLRSRILHDDRKPLNRWLDSQRAYAQVEADHLLASDAKTLAWPDRLRHWIWPAAPAALIYTLIFKGCLFDGWPGWFYVLQRTYAELLLSLELLDRRLRGMGS